MPNYFHIVASRKGIAVAVETKNQFSAELVENGAASSIRLPVEWRAATSSNWSSLLTYKPSKAVSYLKTMRLFHLITASKPKEPFQSEILLETASRMANLSHLSFPLPRQARKAW